MTIFKGFRTLILISLLIFLNSLFAQLTETKLTAPDGSEEDLFGSNVALTDNFAVVGAERRDTEGAVYIYRRAGNTWQFDTGLRGNNAGDYFGSSVGIDDNIVVIGAWGDNNANGEDAGVAYVFERNRKKWREIGRLIPDDGNTEDQFGSRIAISGGYVIVGALADDDNGDRSGSAYIFKREGNEWVQQAKLLASDGVADDEFGYSVAIDDNHAIVGSRPTGTGAAYVFSRNEDEWVEEAILTPGDGASGDGFAISVAISGNLALVGSWRDDDNGFNSGSAYVFEKTASNWIERNKLIASDGSNDDWFGEFVALSGPYALIAARLDDDNGSQSGSVYLFRYDDHSWIENHKLTASDGQSRDNFGLRVAMSPNYALIGAWNDDDMGTDAGSAYIYSAFHPGQNKSSSESSPAVPRQTDLIQNYPNPFNPATNIRYTLAEQSNVSLKVYNLAGQAVRTLINESQSSGTHSVVWDGRDQAGNSVASGIYMYRLETGGKVLTRKMLLAK